MTSNENAEDLRGRLAPEEVVLDAMGAYEGLARCAIMRGGAGRADLWPPGR